MKQLLIVLMLAFICHFKTFAQEKKKLVTYQYMPHTNAKFITGKITDTISSHFKNTKLYWFKIGDDTLIHVWKKDLDTNMIIGKVYTFKGVNKLLYKVFRDGV